MANILIVDDDDSTLSFTKKALENAGHIVCSANDGLDALTELKSTNDYDLLLTDIIMPGMDGMELSKAAKALYPNIEVMFMSGFSAMSLGDKNPENNENAVMAKPFHLKDLVRRVEDALKR